MLPIKQIISPTDFSEPSLEGLRSAVELAEHFDAEIILVHVVETPRWAATAYTTQPPIFDLPDIITSIKEEALEKLSKLQTAMIPARIRSRVAALEGIPADAIVALAAEGPADLIVIATHGYSKFHRFLFGSVTERVVRTAACPVLTIRPKSA